MVERRVSWSFSYGVERIQSGIQRIAGGLDGCLTRIEQGNDEISEGLLSAWFCVRLARYVGGHPQYKGELYHAKIYSHAS